MSVLVCVLRRVRLCHVHVSVCVLCCARGGARAEQDGAGARQGKQNAHDDVGKNKFSSIGISSIYYSVSLTRETCRLSSDLCGRRGTSIFSWSL